MSNDEMRAAIAVAMGWKVDGKLLGPLWAFKPDGTNEPLPDWTGSLDACARDLLPVARERGWKWEYRAMTRAGKEWWCFTAPGVQWSNLAPTGEIALALCTAWLAGPGKVVA